MSSSRWPGLDDSGRLRHSRWRYHTLRQLSQVYFRLFHRLAFVGEDRIPKDGPLLMVANHPTFFDPVLVQLGLQERFIHWLAWDEIFTWPMVGDWVREFGAIPVNLERPAATSLKRCMRVLRAGGVLGMFFEGGRSSTPIIDPPLPGAASLALRFGVTVLPVTISGAYRCWSKHQTIPSPGRITIVYHEAIPVERQRGRDREAEESLTRRIERAIVAALQPDGRAWNPRRPLRPAETPELESARTAFERRAPG